VSAGPQTRAVVVASTTLRVPVPGNPPGQVLALVETDAGHRLVTLAVHPDRRPKPGETIEVGFDA
jgi:hypothetical protein